jgi:hypothetical protein
MAIEVLGRDPGHEGNVVVIGQRLSGKSFAPEDPPPPFNQIQPRRSDRNESVLDAGMGFQPLPDGTAGVAGEVVGNQIQVTSRIGLIQRLEQLQIATGIAGASGLGQRLPIPDAERSIDPDFRRS